MSYGSLKFKYKLIITMNYECMNLWTMTMDHGPWTMDFGAMNNMKLRRWWSFMYQQLAATNRNTWPRLCVSFLREENKIPEVTELVEVACGRQSSLPADSPVRREFCLLQPLLDPLSRDVSIDLLEKNSQKFHDDKQLKLHKVMCNFPTGLLILEEVSKAIVARKKDDQLLVKLDAIAAAAVWPEGVSPQASVKEMAEAAEQLRTVFKQCIEVGGHSFGCFLFRFSCDIKWGYVRQQL